MALKNGAYPFKSAKIDPKIGALPFSWGVIWHNWEKNALKTEHCRSLIKTGSAENQRVDDRKRSISVHFRSKNEDASSVESEHCRFQHLALKRELVMVAKRLKISRISIKKIIRTWRSRNEGVAKARNSTKSDQNRTEVLGWKKTEITLSDVCSSYQSLCAKWFGRVFKNEFLRHAHTTYHVTALLQTFERKNRK